MNNVVGTGNVVSGNFFGIVLTGAGATGNIVRGSLVGTDPTGTIAVGNVRDGILIERERRAISSEARAKPTVTSFPATAGMACTSSDAFEQPSPRQLRRHNRGWPDPSWGTLRKESISPRGRTTLSAAERPAPATSSPETRYGGVPFKVKPATDNRVQGNLIGTDKTGIASLANKYIGASFFAGASANIIGVDGDGEQDGDEGNIIAGNATGGVQIWGSPQNTVAGNWIGVGLDGAPLPQRGPGIWLAGGSHFNWIGTDGDGESDDLERNVISANSGAGISRFQVRGTPTTTTSSPATTSAPTPRARWPWAMRAMASGWTVRQTP